MSKLPGLSSDEVLEALRKIGFAAFAGTKPLAASFNQSSGSRSCCATSHAAARTASGSVNHPSTACVAGRAS